MTQKKIELLAPAGDMERLRMALAYGADAVYLAGTSFGMRSFAGNFTPDELRQAVKLAHEKGVHVHVTCNTMPRNDEVARLPEWLEFLQDAGVDAIIAADVGVLALAKRHAPKVQVHISTQASIVNYQSATAWHDLGASRVILARELSLDEIREIRAKTPKTLELEAFVHGAMCVSYSGRCLLSNYMTDASRDSNRGSCAQPCRYQYALMEEKRPGEYFPVFEDEKGTYIMNSRDMCMIDHLKELQDALTELEAQLEHKEERWMYLTELKEKIDEENQRSAEIIEKTVPMEWIINNGTGISDEFVKYALPLIQGDCKAPLEDGLPRFAKLKKVQAGKK